MYGSDSNLTVPVADNCPIVLITGDALRHERFAMRMHAEFRDQIVGWLKLARPNGRLTQNQIPNNQELGLLRLSAQKLRAIVATFLRQTSDAIPERARFDSPADEARAKASLETVEQRLFGKEVEILRKSDTLRPIAVDGVESEAVRSRIRNLNPYLVLAFCNQSCIAKLRTSFDGVVLSQSDVSEAECGASTSVYWALYHRDLSKIVSSIRIWQNGTDAEIVLRSSTPCFAVDDIPEACFARETAVGTELMCEVVESLLKSRTVQIDDSQRDDVTEMNALPTREIKREVASDLRRGLIKREVSRKMRF
jgi:hypothetical protein